MLAQQHAVAEDVAAHVADADHGEVLGLGVDVHLPEVSLDGLPRALGGDAHGLVVVADRAAGRERVAQPEAVGLGDVVGDVGERGGALVRRHHQVGVVPVATDDFRWRVDLSGRVVDVVGDVEQAGDEQLIAGDALGAGGVPVGRGVPGGQRWPLDDESALGPDRHDDGVLDGLRLDQTQDFGAEVVATVRPAQAAAGHRAEPQVHAFDPRRIDEDLVLGARQRQLVDQLGVQFDRQHVAGPGRTLACHKVIGAQRRLHQRREGAQDAVGVQTHQGVDVGGDRGGGRLRVTAGRGTRVRVEQRLEQRDQGPRGRRVFVEHRFDVGLAVGKVSLPQVLCVGAQEHDLLPAQPRAHHQLVEAVDLEASLPDRGDGVGESLGHLVALGLRRGRLDGRVRRYLELIDPHRQPVGAGDRERPLLEHHHTHALQHRQQLAQRGGAPAQEPGQLGGPVLAFEEHQLDRIVVQLFDDRDVIDGVGRGDGLLVDLGKGVRVVLRVGVPDGAFGGGGDQPVGPGARRFAQHALDADPVVLGDVDRCGVGVVGRQANHEMHERPR